MPTFGYPQLYSNGVNSNTQIRRSTDMVYQRGGNYGITLTGTTYEPSMEMDIDLYSNGSKVGRMSLVPYNITSGATVTYYFNLRPYDYLSNYIQSQHYTNYYLNDWYSTNELINLNNPYPNITKANFKFGWRYYDGTTQVTEYVTSPTKSSPRPHSLGAINDNVNSPAKLYKKYDFPTIGSKEIFDSHTIMDVLYSSYIFSIRSLISCCSLLKTSIIFFDDKFLNKGTLGKSNF